MAPPRSLLKDEKQYLACPTRSDPRLLLDVLYLENRHASMNIWYCVLPCTR